MSFLRFARVLLVPAMLSGVGGLVTTSVAHAATSIATTNAVATNAVATNAVATSAKAPAGPSVVAASAGPRQRITVMASSYGTSYATVRVYQLSGSSNTKWVQVMGPWTARVGYNGVAKPGAKREGDGKTPSGTYGFSFFYGVDANPGVHFSYRHAYTYDYWDDDSSSPRYNEWVDTRTQSPGRAPEPLHNVPAYNYAAVIAYNTARTPGLGSAIFLHVGTGGPTAGCVSLPTADLLKILRWLNPNDHPTITITG